MFKGTIAVVISDETADTPALAAAFELAGRAGGHLDVHCLGLDPTRYEALPAGAAGIVLESGITEAREKAEALKTWALAQAPIGMSRFTAQSLIAATAGLDLSVSRAVRYADVVVASQPYGKASAPMSAAILEAALFQTSAPVLVVPFHQTAKIAPTRPMVAWDESEQSLMALRAALPLLVEAGRVDIVMVDPPSHSEERSDPGGAVSLMLSRHGITAEVSILSKTMPRVSEVLQRFASERGSDLIVMGGYGHSRLREAVFGGVTRDLMARTTIPLLMAH